MQPNGIVAAMSSRRAWTDPECPVARTVDLVGDRWSLLLVRDALEGPRRFSEFQRNLGVAKNILAARLKALVEAGILRVAIDADRTRAGYELTDRGVDLFAIIVGLRQWGERYAFADGEPHSVLVDDETGRPVGRVELRDEDGRTPTPQNSHVRRVGTEST